MAPINTHIVLRSAALHAARGAPYGARFRYEEAMEVKRPVAAKLVAVGTRVGDRLLRSSVGRGLVRRLAPSPGEGPSEEAMAKGFFRTRLVAEAVPTEPAVQVHSPSGWRLEFSALPSAAWLAALLGRPA